jgi:GntR family transcriptional regulator
MAEIPLYGKVEEVLASEIGRGDLKPGDRLPSEDELLARFGVSRITVRRAIQNLIQRGTLEIRRNLGTFVLAPKVSQDLTKLTVFVEDMDILGRKASARTFLALSHCGEPGHVSGQRNRASINYLRR